MKQAQNPATNKDKIRLMTATAVMTAATCLLAPLSLPIGPVPVTLTNFVILLTLYLLGWRMGVVSYAIYLLIGLVGMPVFSGFSGGLGKLMGPTGGYIIGFLPMALIAGIAIEKTSNRVLQFVAMVAGTVACYAFGTAWFCFVMKTTVAAALGSCVIPFIPGDLIKILVVLAVGPLLRTRLRQAGLLQ